MVTVKLPDIMFGSITFENMLSKRVLEWLVILFGFKINSKNELEVREKDLKEKIVLQYSM